MTNEELWQTALAELELSISRPNFITWFQGTKIHSRDKNILVISVPNGFTQEWLKNKYNKFILTAVRNLDSSIKELNYIIAPKDTLIKDKKNISLHEKNEQLDFNNLGFDKNTNLNPKYTFGSFIVGSSNELAYAACRNVTQNLGKSYNPLFIYGGVGLGKTHLLQALGNETVKNFPDKKVKYVSSEKFLNEFIAAIYNKTTESFKDRYRLVDVLIIDDIQFLTGKEQTQEEFFHTFNALYEKNKQIVLSSDRPPKAIATLEERLRSRFEGGMIADIGYPDFEVRVAILKSKIEERGEYLPNDILEYIAQNIQRNIRELEGALNLVLTASKLKNNINAKQAAKLLSNLITKPIKTTSLKNIIEVVSDFYNISSEELLTRNRKKEIAQPRQICMYLLRDELKISYPYIGEKLGGRDHTTVMYACEKIENQIQNNAILEKEINSIRERIYSNSC